MHKLLIATTNPGKLDELKDFLSDLPVELISLKDVGITDIVEETGKTFEENALLKARHYSKKSGLPTLADDGGFEIDALDGEPGVKSHRWVHGDRDSSDEELINYTMQRMKSLPRAKRGAQLRLVLALVLPNGREQTTEAFVRGVVPLQQAVHRHEGFPYRSLLFLPEINKFYDQDEMTPEENDRFNHRKKAVGELKPFIARYLTEEK